jgi:hypothetical protein
VAGRVRVWLQHLGEVGRALLADPVLLAPALLTIAATLAAAFLLWRAF